MKKILMLSVLSLFVVYTLLSLFVEIPKVFNNTFYAIITVCAIFFITYYSEIGKGIKNRFQENRNRMNSGKLK